MGNQQKNTRTKRPNLVFVKKKNQFTIKKNFIIQ